MKDLSEAFRSPEVRAMLEREKQKNDERVEAMKRMAESITTAVKHLEARMIIGGYWPGGGNRNER